MEKLRVYLEEGKRTTFAVALEWPGWCRPGKGDQAALEALEDYRARYLEVIAGSELPEQIEVVGRVTGNSTTDFGAPDAIGPWDDSPLEAHEMRRQAAVLAACWSYFDATAAAAPAELRKGPRGGGRDTAEIISHVREAERAYSSKLGRRLPRNTSWAEQRSAITQSLLSRAEDAKWPPEYAIRRIACHVLDHAWEIQDKS